MNSENWIYAAEQLMRSFHCVPDDERAKKLLSVMQHCIGLDNEKPKRGRYFPYRNYYETGNEHPMWEALIEKGLALKTSNGVYALTPQGMACLSGVLGIHIYSPVARYPAEIRTAVLNMLCSNDVAVCWGAWFPVSGRRLSVCLNIPYDRVMIAVHQLEAEGLIFKTYDGGMSEDGVFCVHGYKLTEKGRDTEEWRAADKKEKEYLNELI